MFEIYYGVLPGEIPVGIPQRRLIRLGYRLSGGAVLSPEPHPEFSGGILGLGHEAAAFNPGEISRLLLPFARHCGMGEIWLDMPQSRAALRLAELLEAAGMPACAPFPLKRGGLVMSSAVLDGSYTDAIASAKQRAGCSRLTVEVAPVSVIFRAGAIEDFSRPALFRLLMRSPAITFSERLCLNTISFREADGSTSLVAYDDGHTLSKKLEFAAELGIERVFLRHGLDLKLNTAK